VLEQKCLGVYKSYGSPPSDSSSSDGYLRVVGVGGNPAGPAFIFVFTLGKSWPSRNLAKNGCLFLVLIVISWAEKILLPFVECQSHNSYIISAMFRQQIASITFKVASLICKGESYGYETLSFNTTC
jgi:hypothetical protein